jgi:GTP-binding protein EngB required for normal cell division
MELSSIDLDNNHRDSISSGLQDLKTKLSVVDDEMSKYYDEKPFLLQPAIDNAANADPSRGLASCSTNAAAAADREKQMDLSALCSIPDVGLSLVKAKIASLEEKKSALEDALKNRRNDQHHDHHETSPLNWAITNKRSDLVELLLSYDACAEEAYSRFFPLSDSTDGTNDDDNDDDDDDNESMDQIKALVHFYYNVQKTAKLQNATNPLKIGRALSLIAEGFTHVKEKFHNLSASPEEQLPQRTVIFFGYTSVGKSTMINYLLGAEYKAQGAYLDVEGGRDVTERRDRKSKSSTTVFPNIFQCGSGESGMSLVDTPGFFDSRGLHYQLAGAELTKSLNTCLPTINYMVLVCTCDQIVSGIDDNTIAMFQMYADLVNGEGEMNLENVLILVNVHDNQAVHFGEFGDLKDGATSVVEQLKKKAEEQFTTQGGSAPRMLLNSITEKNIVIVKLTDRSDRLARDKLLEKLRSNSSTIPDKFNFGAFEMAKKFDVFIEQIQKYTKEQEENFKYEVRMLLLRSKEMLAKANNEFTFGDDNGTHFDVCEEGGQDNDDDDDHDDGEEVKKHLKWHKELLQVCKGLEKYADSRLEDMNKTESREGRSSSLLECKFRYQVSSKFLNHLTKIRQGRQGEEAKCSEDTI